MGGLVNMSKVTARAIDENTWKFLTIATFLTLVTNAFIIVFLGTYQNLIFGAIQCIWTIAGIFLLWRIYSASSDKTLKDLSLLFGIALVPWTITLLLWKILLPTFYYNDLAFYVTGFGFLGPTVFFFMPYGTLLNLTDGTSTRRKTGSSMSCGHWRSSSSC